MFENEAYFRAINKISAARRANSKKLDLSGKIGAGISDALTELPKPLAELKHLEVLDLSRNMITQIPEWIGDFKYLRKLYLYNNLIEALPESISKLTNLQSLDLGLNKLTQLPESISSLVNLQRLDLYGNELTSLPLSMGHMDELQFIRFENNPLPPELAAVSEQKSSSIISYLKARAKGSVVLNEGKLILIGEGEVGKSCLLDALRDEPWKQHESTHGIEIKPVFVTCDSKEGSDEITLNTWDFGGQKVYRPTHQLFFSAPALYLVIWKPREGPQQGAVEYWINSIKYRAGQDARILIVATHGGPQQRQPDVDLQDLRDKYGEDIVLGAYHVDSRPAYYDSNTGNWHGPRKGIAELKNAIGEIVLKLPNVGREVPQSWESVLSSLRVLSSDNPYISYSDYLCLCERYGVSGDLASTYAKMLNELGYVIHYGVDRELKKLMILKPDWLAKALSFVLDDEYTRARNGLIDHDYLGRLWGNPPYDYEDGYPEDLHPLFLRLMERYDLSYQVTLNPTDRTDTKTSLVAQLVSDKPMALAGWDGSPRDGDEEKRQVCKIVERDSGQSANAEGLFYRLIARLHKYSLGRNEYSKSIHWQKGLMLEDRYNGRALIRHVGNDIHITVRAAYPDFFLYELTKEVEWLVENQDEGWAGLRCDIMVPCVDPCGLDMPGTGMYEVGKLKESRRQGRSEYPCNTPGCTAWQSIDSLLQNSTISRRAGLSEEDIMDVQNTITEVVRSELSTKDENDQRRYLELRSDIRRAMSRVDEQYESLIQMYADEARDGPRLFSIAPRVKGILSKPHWIAQTFQIMLWCEHSRMPLPVITGDRKRGVYELELTRDWVKKTAPLMKLLSNTLGLVLPLAGTAVQAAIDSELQEKIEDQINFGLECAESMLEAKGEAGEWINDNDNNEANTGNLYHAHGSVLRELHAILRDKDPGYGGLERVQNKRREYLWVHPKYLHEYGG